MDFLKILVIIGFSTMKYCQNNKIIKGKIYATSFSSKFHSRMFISLKFISTGCYPSKFHGKYFNFVWFKKLRIGGVWLLAEKIEHYF